MRTIFSIAAACTGIFASTAVAKPLTPGDVLVAESPQNSKYAVLAEYTPAGSLVQSWNLGANGSSVEGIAVDQNLTPYVYCGQSSGLISAVNPQTSVVSTFTYPGLSMDGSTANGGLCCFGQYLYATDWDTGGSSTVPNGIVRFDLNNGAAGERFFSPNPGTSYSNGNFEKVSVGLNGVLYAIQGMGSYKSYEVIAVNPLTMTAPVQLSFPEAADALAVDASGNYFIARDGGIDEYSPSYQLLGSLSLGTSAFFTNVDLSAGGQILISTNGGVQYLTDTSLKTYTSFAANGLLNTNDYVTQSAAMLVEPPVSVPEPTCAFALGAGFILCRPRKRG